MEENSTKQSQKTEQVQCDLPRMSAAATGDE